MTESDPNIKRGLFLSIECMNTLNEGILLHHASVGCPKPQWSKYLSFLKSRRFSELTQPKYWKGQKVETVNHVVSSKSTNGHPKIHTLFSTECSPYFDWQTVGLMHSFRSSKQPGNVTRLLSCTDDDLKNYKGHDLAPTHYVPSMNQHPLTGDWYNLIVLHNV
jgi:peptidyl serine alpha-galactosyltransferase